MKEGRNEHLSWALVLGPVYLDILQSPCIQNLTHFYFEPTPPAALLSPLITLSITEHPILEI